MMDRIFKLLEGIAISPKELDVLNHFSKSTPRFELDNLEEEIKNKYGYTFDIVHEDDNTYSINIMNGKNLVTKVNIDKHALLTGRISVDYLLR